MNETSLNPVPAKSTGTTNTKPRLSLISSRQSGIRLKSSEELPDKPGTLNFVQRDVNENNSNNSFEGGQVVPSTRVERLVPKSNEAISRSNELLKNPETEQLKLNNTNRSSQERELSGHNQQIPIADGKSSFNIEDLFRIMTLLKSDLQTKEIALNSFKTEQLKRLINPIEIKKSSLASAYIELQDRLESKRGANNGNIKPKQRSSSASGDTNHNRKEEISNRVNCLNSVGIKKKQLSVDQAKECGSNTVEVNNDYKDDETLNIMMALLEILDRHPLLALPRDSMYCLDYACNDISTKNYLNLKIQGLENLIDQHKRFRYYMSERLKRSEQRYMDLTLKLELERKLRLENEMALYRSGGKAVLLDHIDQLKKSLEHEKSSKQAIVMTLLNELLDEREKNETLQQKVIELEKKLVGNKLGHQASQTNAPISSKPRVPAKPAQLLDRQRSQSKTSR